MVTETPQKEISEIEKALKAKKINPREAKVHLAREIVGIHHFKKEAIKAENEFDKIFIEHKVAEINPLKQGLKHQTF